MEKFKQLRLSEGMIEGMRHAGFTEPSEIQEKTIPLVLAGKDVFGSSATGSGKTLAFGAGIIEKVERGRGIQCLILTPTRELAEQVASTLRNFSRYKRLEVQDVYGGVGMGQQIRGLRSADIVVGTPGRILDHLQRRTLVLSRIKFLVLDEADRMLDMGFIRDVDKIIHVCPSPRQTLLFSATLSKEILAISRKYLHDPVSVTINNAIDPSLLSQSYYDVSSSLKFALLVTLLKHEKSGLVMVFCNTRRNADRITRGLGQCGIHAQAIHGGLSQNQRNYTLRSFHARENLILVCTDVAARGLDVRDVSHVYNFDLPASGTDYIHRIGRTARAGKNGQAISFVSSGEHGEFRQICKQSSLNIVEEKVPPLETLPSNFIPFSSENRRNFRGGGGGRGLSRVHRGSMSKWRNGPRRDEHSHGSRRDEHEGGSRGRSSGRFGRSRSFRR